MPLRLHSRRPEAAAEDKCKFEARAGEREWQTDTRAVPSALTQLIRLSR